MVHPSENNCQNSIIKLTITNRCHKPCKSSFNKIPLPFGRGLTLSTLKGHNWQYNRCKKNNAQRKFPPSFQTQGPPHQIQLLPNHPRNKHKPQETTSSLLTLTKNPRKMKPWNHAFEVFCLPGTTESNLKASRLNMFTESEFNLYMTKVSFSFFKLSCRSHTFTCTMHLAHAVNV